ncbi:MAG: glutamate mutase L [Myxococcota bacterium]
MSDPSSIGRPALDWSRVRSVLATDCGSTTTKAILIERQPDGTFCLTARGEAPTTVEAPFEDVTHGVRNAALEVQELCGRRLVREEGEDGCAPQDWLLRPQTAEGGVDAYISTSSAGGGLQMVAMGVVSSMSTDSALRAALGAGAVVMDAFSIDDGRPPHQKIERIRQLRPDMVVMAGGVDGGTQRHVLQLAEIVSAASPKPRLGSSYSLPVVYAGNQDCRTEVERILADKVTVISERNVRPTLEEEDLLPARERIHDLFLEHVMRQAPGYPQLIELADAQIVPTPGAVGHLIRSVAEERKQNVLGVDIGGATTDVFSVFGGRFNRTVSANLGMSYSVNNVLVEAGFENVVRWLPFDCEQVELRNRVGNKMIRPTTVPVDLVDLQIEQAIAREALRLALKQHKEFAVELRGIQTDRTISDAFRQSHRSRSLIRMNDLDLVIGSGGVLSHAPRRVQAMRILIDAFLPQGFTEIAVDSIFMMPHLGALAAHHPEAAAQVFERDCLVRLGTCIAPVGRARIGAPCLRVLIEAERRTHSFECAVGELRVVALPLGEFATVQVTPTRRFDLGNGFGTSVQKKVGGGVVGMVFDTRGRPKPWLNGSGRLERLRQWSRACEEYPEGHEDAIQNPQDAGMPLYG